MAGTLHLRSPDWEALDTAARRPEPFVLWPVGDQPLLAHWLDYAVNEGYEAVEVHVADRPAEVRAWLEAATLWPLQRSCRPLRTEAEAPAEAHSCAALPGLPPPPAPADGWGLLDYWQALERQWLDEAFAGLQVPGVNLAVGRDCQIHPGAKLVPPYWLGDRVSVGPGAVVGPHALVGEGAVLAGDNEVVRARVLPHTYLGPQTALVDAVLDGARLLHRARRVRLDLTEGFLARSLAKPAGRGVPLGERLLALRLALVWPAAAPAAGTFRALSGLELPAAAPGEPWLAARRAWLPLVWAGKLRLFGVLPRPETALEGLPAGWADLLRAAPAGLFSYADLHGAHVPGQGDEALHAAYQASQPESALRPALERGLRAALRRR